MNTPFDTQKVRIDLREALQHAEKAYAAKPSLESLSLIRWITNKLMFFDSPMYQERKQKVRS